MREINKYSLIWSSIFLWITALVSFSGRFCDFSQWKFRTKVLSKNFKLFIAACLREMEPLKVSKLKLKSFWLLLSHYQQLSKFYLELQKAQIYFVSFIPRRDFSAHTPVIKIVSIIFTLQSFMWLETFCRKSILTWHRG